MEWTGRPTDAAFTLRWTFDRAELQDAVEAQSAFKRRFRLFRLLLLVAMIVLAVDFAVHPTWSSGGRLAGALVALLLIQALPWFSVRQ